MNRVAYVIAVTNQKGGVGKTTTAVNVSACLAENGKRTLLIDLDPQGNATSGLGIDKEILNTSIYDCLIDSTPLQDILQPSVVKKLQVAPSTLDVAGASVELVNIEQREYVLRERIKPLLQDMKKAFEYIIIDCPPSLGLLTINALTAADYVLIPVQCEFYALEGLAQLMKTIDMVRTTFNHSLKELGLILTMYDGRTNLSIQVAEEVKKYFKGTVFKTIIPRNVRLGEAPSHGVPITVYDGHSKGAEVYKKLTKEVMHRVV